MATPLKVLLVAAEVVPFAKVGGLADVAGALPKALEELGHDVRVAMPRYGQVDPAKFGLRTVVESLSVPMDGTREQVRIMEGRIGKAVPVYLVDSHKYFHREGIYGYQDDDERWILFCRAVVEMLKPLNWQPDIIHCNDWHTAIIPNWLKTIYKDDPFFARTATVYTIHNLQYQGVFGWRVLEIAGIDAYGYLHHPSITELDNVVALMARGIIFADVINTVSEKYAQEILTPEYGEKLDPLLRDRADRLFGIVNGIDYEDLNPTTDKYIAANFDEHALDRRLENKLALQRESNLREDPEVPLIGMIGRLASQKGFDLIGNIIDPLMDLDLQMVLLGTGDQNYHDMFSRIASTHRDKFAVFLTFNTPLAQKIYAGSDMFLMPSRFEPCGLGQLIAMRYGGIPIVRWTGGLADTVKDFDPRNGTGDGFVFGPYDRWMLFTAIVRALENYKYRDTWGALQKRVMQKDFSWKASARKYAGLYDKAIGFRRAVPV